MDDNQKEEEKNREVRRYVKKEDVSSLSRILGINEINFNHLVGAIQEEKIISFKYLYERYCKEEKPLIKEENDVRLLQHIILHKNDEAFEYLTSQIDVNKNQGLYWAINYSFEEYIEKLQSKGAFIEYNNHAILRLVLQENNSLIKEARVALTYQLYVNEKKEDIAWKIIEDDLNDKSKHGHNVETTRNMMEIYYKRVKEIRAKEELNDKLEKELPIASDIAKSKL